MSRERQLARLFRALIACCAFLFAVEAPLVPAWSARDASGWLAERPPAPAMPREARGSFPSRPSRPRTVSRAAVSRAGVSSAAASSGAAVGAVPELWARAAAHSAMPETNGSRLDRRYLFLEIETLLC